jgi:hypothetical protein
MSLNLDSYTFFSPLYGRLPGVSEKDDLPRDYSSEEWTETYETNPITQAAAHGFVDGRFPNKWHSTSEFSSTAGPAYEVARPRVLPIDVIFPFYSAEQVALLQKSTEISGAKTTEADARIAIAADVVLDLLFSEKVVQHEQWPLWVAKMRDAGHQKEIDFLLSRDAALKKRFEDAQP